MTENHLVISCDGLLVYARYLHSGSCLQIADGDATVVSIKRVRALGITAVTMNEFIFVGGIKASPFGISHTRILQYPSCHLQDFFV